MHLYTAADVETYKAAYSEMRAGSTLLFSDSGQIENIITMIGTLPPAAIVIHLDGDDMLTQGATDVIAKAYEDPDVWLTYGSFRRSDGMRDRDWHAPFGTRYAAGSPRRQAWRASHLRTFRAGLFQALPSEALIDPATGSYFTTCVDRAIMLGMLELVGERYRVIQDILCVYNVNHDRSMSEQERAIESSDRETIHAMRPLAPLTARPW
jgi:hypothetical protein